MIVNELINPKSIVVVGGSNDITKPGGRVMKNLLEGGFTGDVCVVNPKEDLVQGLKCYRSIGDVPNVDLAIIAIAAKFIPDTLRTLTKEKSTKGFIILSAGFSEVDAAGKALEREIVEIIESVGGSLIGPNCVGVMNSNYRGAFSCAVPRLEPDGCDFVTGSGATASFVLEYAIPLGLKFSSLFSVGNSAQLGVEEVLKYWDENYVEGKSSRIKMIYIEKMDRPQMFLKHASSLIRKGCKIAAIKAGTTEAGSRERN
jgi:acetyltransferase